MLRERTVLQLEFSSVTITFFMHATEDHERLVASVSKGLGLDEKSFKSEEINGHFGNKIVSVKAHLTGKDAQRKGAFILSSLSSTAKAKLLGDLDRSVDEHDALYLRIDRQTIQGGITLGDQEPIRVKLKPKFRSGGRSSMLNSYRELIE